MHDLHYVVCADGLWIRSWDGGGGARGADGGPETVTLFFDGNPQVFNIRDLAVAVALFLATDADLPAIEAIAFDIFGLTLSPSDITGAGPNPLEFYDLNGDGQQGQIQDLGVALAAFLGAQTAEAAEQICQDVLGLSCEISPGVGIPGQTLPESGTQVTIFPNAGDPTIASFIEQSTNEAVTFFGEKDSQGIPQNIIQFIYEKQDQTSIANLDDQGRHKCCTIA